jgi:hypothetical protein
LAAFYSNGTKDIMKRHFGRIGFLLVLFTTVVSCNKEPVSKGLSPFYKLTVNGSKKSVHACGTSDHVAEYLKDTAVFAGFGCGGQRGGFSLKGLITDGTYHLDNMNQAWYDEGQIRYATDSLHQGSLTIRTKYYQAVGGSIPYIEGEIAFDAIDKNTGRTINVKNGTYLLKKFQY